MTCKSFLSVQKKTFTNDSKKRRRNAFFQRFPVDKLIIIDFNTIHSNQSQEAKHWSSCRTFLEGPRGDCCWEGIYHCYIPRNTSYMHDILYAWFNDQHLCQNICLSRIPGSCHPTKESHLILNKYRWESNPFVDDTNIGLSEGIIILATQTLH